MKSRFVFCLPKSLIQTTQTKFGLNLGQVIVGSVFEFIVIPAKAGIQNMAPDGLDASLRWHDKMDLESFVSDCCTDALLINTQETSQFSLKGFGSGFVVCKKPGITDDIGTTAEKVFEDKYSQKSPKIFVHEIYFFESKLDTKNLENIAYKFAANPLIHQVKAFENSIQTPFLNRLDNQESPKTKNIPVPASQEEQIALSQKHGWGFSLEELDAIAAYFEERPEPTDCEWEILAQTWSEHCKHKEFNADIKFTDLSTGLTREINSIFKSKIKGSTEHIHKTLGDKSYLVKVFNDNAGVVRLSPGKLFVWKVETHNTPSALDPYGGAITGILGNNRDAMGTGIGGAKLLFNTNVLCFGPQDYAKPLLKGQWHPKFIQEGVVAGIRDGGNQSGVPTVNGSVIYDERYAGKPLVFCGTGALMPEEFAGKKSWEKNIQAGDLIFMAGGKVGRDGIHGATASSLEADSNISGSIVQLGSAWTQRFLYDFLRVAAERGLIKCSTDNGAGGLSSSVGELAEISGGAKVELHKVPLKTDGLAPWEIFLSESQERMTLVCEPKNAEALCKLARDYEVECTEIGLFTSTGFLEVYSHHERVAYLDLEFLHNGVPKKSLEAHWGTPKLTEPQLPKIDYKKALLALLASPQICSRKAIISQYDHEVKGKTIIKPLMGSKQNAPQDAAVVQLGFDSYQGVAVSNGICPKFGDLDPYEMSAGAFDEAVRGCIAVGAKLSSVWSVNDNFCVPNSVYHPIKNPDGKEKLGKLVRMAEALHDMAVSYLIPMTSGKDSMKNDYVCGDIKISVPPTVLYSMVASVEDIRNTVTSEWKSAGDLIYLIGKTFNELGGSEFYQLFGELGANVPRVRKDLALDIYRKMGNCHDEKLLKSAHDLSDGGLAVALAESSFGAELGADISLEPKYISLEAELFSESHSRFVVSVSPQNQAKLESLMGDLAILLGHVRGDNQFVISAPSLLIESDTDKLHAAWESIDCHPGLEPNKGIPNG